MKSELIRVTKHYTFDMAHALHGYDGACRNIHGHTYHLFVTIKGRVKEDDQHPKNGMVMDFSDLKKIVYEHIINPFDHALVLKAGSPHERMRDLQDEFDRVIFLDRQPSCENLMLHFKNLLAPHFNADRQLVYVKLMETPTSYAEWHLTDNL